jgi:hypothetical protein
MWQSQYTLPCSTQRHAPAASSASVLVIQWTKTLNSGGERITIAGFILGIERQLRSFIFRARRTEKAGGDWPWLNPSSMTMEKAISASLNVLLAEGEVKLVISFSAGTLKTGWLYKQSKRGGSLELCFGLAPNILVLVFSCIAWSCFRPKTLVCTQPYRIMASIVTLTVRSE